MYIEFDHQILTKHAFALVDSSVLDFLPEGLVAVPVVPPKMPSSAHLMPGLLDLGSLSQAAKSALLTMLYRAQKDREAPVVALFIEADITSSEFIQYWNRVQIAMPSPERKFWLRLHDPRVLHQLLRILSAPQWKRLLGPLLGVTYWVGDAWAHAGRHATVGEAKEYPDSSSWPWDRVLMVGIINRALEGAGISQSAILHDNGAAVEELANVAITKFNLTDQADLVEFAVRGLLSSPIFYDHPTVAPTIRPSGDPDDDSRLSDRLALLSDTIWSELSSTVS